MKVDLQLERLEIGMGRAAAMIDPCPVHQKQSVLYLHSSSQMDHPQRM